MTRSGSSHLSQVMMVLLLLSIFFHHTESALSSDLRKLSIAESNEERRTMSYYKPNADIGTRPSTSRPAPGGNGRKLMSMYKPNGDIFTGPSNSGHGGGRIHQHSSP